MRLLARGTNAGRLNLMGHSSGPGTSRALTSIYGAETRVQPEGHFYDGNLLNFDTDRFSINFQSILI